MLRLDFLPQRYFDFVSETGHEREESSSGRLYTDPQACSVAGHVLVLVQMLGLGQVRSAHRSLWLDAIPQT
jgi:hypothetical protein